MTTVNPPTDIALPPGATDGCEWWDDVDRRYRCVESENRVSGNARVYAHCLQWDDGSIEPGNSNGLNRPGVSLDCDDEQGWTDTGIALTAAQARALAGYLVEAADHVDQWTGQPYDAAALNVAMTVLESACEVLRSAPGNAGCWAKSALDAVVEARTVLR